MTSDLNKKTDRTTFIYNWIATTAKKLPEATFHHKINYCRDGKVRLIVRYKNTSTEVYFARTGDQLYGCSSSPEEVYDQHKTPQENS